MAVSVTSVADWQEVDPVDVVRGPKVGRARWNVTPCNALVVQFPGEPCAYRLDLRQVVAALVAQRTAEHDPPPALPPADPPRSLRRRVRAWSLPVAILAALVLVCGSGCGLLLGWFQGEHKHNCKAPIGSFVQQCTDCGKPCLSSRLTVPNEVI